MMACVISRQHASIQDDINNNVKIKLIQFLILNKNLLPYV